MENYMYRIGLTEVDPSVFASWPGPSAHPVTRGHSILLYTAILGPLALATTIGRLWSRFRLQRNAGLEDWFHIAVLPIVVALVVCANLANAHYFIKHTWEIEARNVEIMAELAWWIQLLYLLSIGFIKQSVLLFYRRISSSGASKSFHLLILLMSIFQGLTTTIWFFLTVFSCAPAYAYWARFNDAWQNISYNTYTCNLAGPTPVIIMSIISIIQDFVCAAVPFLIIYKLKVPRRQRIAIFVIFFFAFAACIIAVVRCHYIFQAWIYTGDIAWYGYSVWETSVVEVLVAMTVSSLPAVKYIFRNYFDKSTSQDDSDFKDYQARVADALESGWSPIHTLARPHIGTVLESRHFPVMTKTPHAKGRSKSHAFIPFSQEEALEIIALEKKLKPKLSERSISDPLSTPATKLEEAFTADVAALPGRTPSCQEQMLRQMGIIAPDQWQWDVSDLQERSPSRQEQDLREAGIIKKDEWSEWDGGRILRLGEEHFKSSLLQEGIVTPYPGSRENQPDYFSGFEAIKAGTKKKALRDNSLSQISP